MATILMHVLINVATHNLYKIRGNIQVLNTPAIFLFRFGEHNICIFRLIEIIIKTFRLFQINILILIFITLTLAIPVIQLYNPLFIVCKIWSEKLIS